eukprot:TRINITY_DN6669_c0_g1_i1.p1 TRINITY_DN6669_c0_g1~~TRINITY_DN6669_c0_g1_i1.p1  ORF type:complete len:411 (+),score=124.59 TRINITY_DN6669_c0_g1_i1:58-1233(+)
MAALDVRLKGVLDGAPFCILEPAAWNGRVLLYAHGYRPVREGEPRVPDAVEIDADGDCYRQLREEGWLVAATMYRRDGVIIRDALEDVVNLRNFLVGRYERHFGRAVETVLVEGQSMGGAVATRLAERVPFLFHGVLGVGAALLTREDKMNADDKATALLHAPVMPILYLTNESEMGPIEQYIANVQEMLESSPRERSGGVYAGPDGEHEVVLPALWSVARAGHNWTNQDERYAAVQGLLNWVVHGTFITCRRTCGTKPPVFKPSVVKFAEDGQSAVGAILSCSDGSFQLNFNESDFAQLGIVRPGTCFAMSLLGRDHTVTFDEYPFIHSKKGALVAMLEADHREVLLTVHNVVTHECLRKRLGRFMTGDAVAVRRVEKRVGRLSIPENLR